MPEIKDTEQQILDAAKRVFMQKGMGAARMQEIANEAGINKALLHYYFRSKDKLFEAVFLDTLQEVGPAIQAFFEEDDSLFDKLDRLVDTYIDLMKERPYLPAFVIGEMNRDPERLIALIKEANYLPKPQALLGQLMEAQAKGEVKAIAPIDLVLNVISLCIFPVAVSPMLRQLFSISEQDFAELLEHRKQTVKDFVHNALQP